MEEKIGRELAVVLCSHIAEGKSPILLAVRDEPEEEYDSGWQFLCNSTDEEDWENAKVCSVEDVLKIEPTLEEYIDTPANLAIVRKDESSPWEEVEL